jgi:hypothetical protein
VAQVRLVISFSIKCKVYEMNLSGKIFIDLILGWVWYSQHPDAFACWWPTVRVFVWFEMENNSEYSIFCYYDA